MISGHRVLSDIRSGLGEHTVCADRTIGTTSATGFYVQTLVADYVLQAQLSRLPEENLKYLALVTIGEKYVVNLVTDDQSESFVGMEFLVLRQSGSKLHDIRLPQIIET